MRQKNVNGFRPCSTCGEMLTAVPEHFYRKKDGSLSSECRDCFRRRSSKNQKKRHHAGGEDYHLSYLMRGVRHRARKGSIECDLDAGFLKILLSEQSGLCAISGIPLTFIKGHGHIPTNASVDRIDVTKGYAKGNIQLVAHQVNTMKSNLSLDQLIVWCKLILKEKP